MTSNNATRKKRDIIDDRIEFEYTGREVVPKNVTHVRFHPSVNEVGGYDYDNYGDLAEIADGYGFKDCNRLKEVIFNDGLKKIGQHSFRYCTALESITLPSTLTEIEIYGFSGCSNLEEVVLNGGLMKVEDGTFHDCESLQKITIPYTVSCIGSAAFHNCINLREVVFNEGLKKIGANTFMGCKSLQSITFPSSLIEIGNGAFNYCHGLKEVELREGIQRIGHGTFGACPLLEMFTFPRLSSRLENIIQVGHWSEVKGKIDEYNPSVVRRGSEIFVSAAVMNSPRIAGFWSTIKEDIDQVHELISHYEKKEATSLFELALWKVKIIQAGYDDTNRETCRLEVPGPVKDTILAYLT